jgi:hypothetical protein
MMPVCARIPGKLSNSLTMVYLGNRICLLLILLASAKVHAHKKELAMVC